MEIFAFLGLLIGLFMFLITSSNQITDKIEKELDEIESFNRNDPNFNKLLEHNKLDFLYDKLILSSTLNLLITGLLLLSASAYKTELDCVPFLIIIIVIYIPSVAITYLTYLYYVNIRALKNKNVA